MWDLLTDPGFWLAVAIWVLLFAGAFYLLIHGAETLDPYDPRGYSDAEMRRAEKARADVAQQARGRTFKAWDAELDRVWPANVSELPTREPAQVIDFPRQIGGWRR